MGAVAAITVHINIADKLRAENKRLSAALKQSEAGELKNALAVGQACIELQEERNENDRLRAENARLQESESRLQAWHDVVMEQPVLCHLVGPYFGIPEDSICELTYRPQPLAKE